MNGLNGDLRKTDVPWLLAVASNPPPHRSMSKSQQPASSPSMDPDDRAADRRRFVNRQIRSRGVTTPAVLDAMMSVPRHHFVAPDLADSAYEDRPLPIGRGQTISQPFMVALMVDAAMVGPGDHVLEVGTGSGYGAAVLGRLARSVVTIERHGSLARSAAARLAALGVSNVEVIEGDGSLGWSERAPYDAIVVTAAGPSVPAALRAQMADGARLIMPVGRRRGEQRLLRIIRSGDRYDLEDLGGVRFVPLVGEQGIGGPASDEQLVGEQGADEPAAGHVEDDT